MEIILLLLIFVLVLIGSFWAKTNSRLKAIERKLNALILQAGADPTQSRIPLSERVKKLATDPLRELEAIRAYEQETGSSFQESREAVRSFVERR